ncbi:hypothetical protein ACTXT7_017593, partial [Hymenolepis weldensis]
MLFIKTSDTNLLRSPQARSVYVDKSYSRATFNAYKEQRTYKECVQIKEPRRRGVPSVFFPRTSFHQDEE